MHIFFRNEILVQYLHKKLIVLCTDYITVSCFSFNRISLIEELGHILNDECVQPEEVSLSTTWQNRQSLSHERWHIAREAMVKNRLAAEHVQECICQHCLTATVRCRDVYLGSIYAPCVMEMSISTYLSITGTLWPMGSSSHCVQPLQ